MSQFTQNFITRHTLDQQVNRSFTTLKVGDAALQDNIAFEVIGKASFNGSLIVGESITTDHVDLISMTFVDGNEVNGRVMTSDDSGNISLVTKLWHTIDNPELPAGPSNNKIYTPNSVAIGTTTGAMASDELLVIGTTTNQGMKVGDINIFKQSSTVSTIVHSALKSEGTSYVLQTRSDGLSKLNAKTDIQFLNNDNINMVLLNNGNVGIGITNPTIKLHVDGDTIVEGDLTVNGNLTTISSTNLELVDTIISLAKGNTSSSVDIGFYGTYDTNKYTGLIRDASTSDKRYILFNNSTTEPLTSLTGSYDYGILQLDKLVVETGITASNALTFNHTSILYSGTTGSIQFTNDSKIGIGITNPTSHLEVVGNTKITGNIGLGTTPVSDVSLYSNTTTAIRMPSGNTSQRPASSTQGYFRYNTQNNSFEGHNNLGWIPLGASRLSDIDGNTYIDPEATSNNNQIQFYTNGNYRMVIDENGKIGINQSTPTISFEINKTDAILIPKGTAAQRPTGVDGYFRYNTDDTNLEFHNGTTWTFVNSFLSNPSQTTKIIPGVTTGENYLRFTTNGTEHMTLTSLGKFGLGTTNPTISFEINKTDAMLIPKGPLSQRPSASAGYIRFNTDNSTFEGYDGGDWHILNGLRDYSGNTYITAEETADEDKLHFYTDGIERMVIMDTGKIGIGTTNPLTALDVNGTLTVDAINVSGDVVIDGGLTVYLGTTTIGVTNLVADAPLFKVGNLNIADTADIGFYAQYVTAGVTKYTGLFRDASDGRYKLFKDLEVEPTTTSVNTGATGYADADLYVSSLQTNNLVYYITDLSFTNPSAVTTMSLTNAGFLGIGITNPSHPLHVAKTNGGWQAKFSNSGSEVYLANSSGLNGALINSNAPSSNTSYALNVRSADNSNILYVTNDNKVGILTSTPAYSLDINTSTIGDGIKVGSAFIGINNATSMQVGHVNYAGSTTAYALKQNNVTGETSINSPVGTSTVFRINNTAVAKVLTNGFMIGNPSVQSNALNVAGNSSLEGNLSVDTNILFVDATNDRVGVGISAPLGLFHVSGTGGSKFSDIGANDTTEIIQIYQGTGTITNSHYSLKGYFSGTTYPNNVTFQSLDSSGPTTHNLITMGLTGNVGINNLNPQEKLDISGNALISGNLTVDTNTLFVDATNNRVGIKTITPAYELDVTGNAYISGNITIGGNITMNGPITQSLIINDPLIKMGDGNSGDLVDIGFYGQYNNGLNQVYTGLFRDATDGSYKLFESLQAEPTSTVNVAGTGYTLSNLSLAGLTASGNVSCTEIITTSDIRAKDNIKKIDYNVIGKKLLDLDIYEYNFKDSDEKTFGLIAQELEEVIPECVNTMPSKTINGEVIENFKSIKTNVLITSLLSSIKYLQERIEKLEKIQKKN